MLGAGRGGGGGGGAECSGSPSLERSRLGGLGFRISGEAKARNHTRQQRQADESRLFLAVLKFRLEGLDLLGF